MKNKKFDCVEMMHDGARHVQKQVEGMLIHEEVEFWKEQTKKLRDLKSRPKVVKKAS